MTVPRRLRPGPEERQLVTNQTASVLSARGGVPSARPVAAGNTGVQPFTPPPAAAGPLASADYSPSAASWASYAGQYRARFDGFTIGAGFDDYGTHFSPTSNQMDLLTAGYYQASAEADVGGATDGEVIRLVLVHPGLNDGSSVEAVVAGGSAYLSVRSLPFPVLESDITGFLNYFEAYLLSPSGTGTPDPLHVAVVRLAGAAPVQTL